MINEYKLRHTVICAALFFAASSVLGRFVVMPYGRMILEAMPPWVIGMGLVSLGLFLGEALFCFAANRKSLRRLRSDFSNYPEEIRLAGVKTPVDFSFAMTQQVNYVKLSVLPGRHACAEVYSNAGAIRESIKAFEERFGRKPKGAETLDWNYMNLLEAAGQLGRSEEEVSGSMILEIITDSVLNYYRKRNHGVIDLFI